MKVDGAKNNKHKHSHASAQHTQTLSSSDSGLEVRGPMDTTDSQTWLCALSFLKTTQPRAYTLGCLRCQNKRLRAIFQDIPSWKILDLSEICNYPDYPHVRKLLRGLVHPLVGLEPTYAPGRPHRQIVSELARVWSRQNAPPLYHDLDLDILPFLGSPRERSAPPSYRARDDLDFYKGDDMSELHWHGHDPFIFVGPQGQIFGPLEVFADGDEENSKQYLEHRSQDWVGIHDSRYHFPEPWSPTPWRTLRAIADRRYSGAGVFGQP